MKHHASQFHLGMRKFFAGFSFLFARPKLWWMALVPLAISIIVLIVMFAGFFHYFGDIYSWIIAHMGGLHLDNPDVWWMHAINGLLWFIDLILKLIVLLVSVILILLAFYVITLIIASPFNDLLSERVEEEVTGVASPPFSIRRLIHETGHTMWVETLKGLLFIAVPVVSLIVLIIPIIGGPLYLAVTIIFGMWDLGFTYLDYPMGRKHMSFGDRLRFAWQHRMAMIGFGLIFIIPFASFFIIAPMTVGGTLLYMECTKSGAGYGVRSTAESIENVR